MSASDCRAVPFRDLPRLAQVNLVLLAGTVLAFSVWLWPDWRHNPDLSHGIFMPLVFAALLHEARQSPLRLVRSTGLSIGGLAVLLTFALLALFAAGLYAAAVDWSHPLVDCALALAVVLYLGAALLLFAHERVGFIGWNWSAGVGIVLWLLCTPIPPGTYTRLTLALQLWVTEAVLRTLHLLGIAAIRHGNIIALSHTTVGVEEACSGVRSLISCIFAGLFFSATLVRRPAARALIIALSAPLALGMNFLRSLTLTLLSNNGVDISGAWHDVTGFAVLGVTALILAGLALALERKSSVAPLPDPTAPTRRPSVGRQVVLLATLGVAAAMVLFFVANTRPSIRRDTPTPNLDALLPKSAPGWQVSTSDNLYQFQDTLHTDHLAQRTYRRANPDGHVTELILYVAYWKPGQAPVSLVASHTPDACWPGSGWAVQPVTQPRATLVVAGRSLSPAEYRKFTFNDFPQFVWYWHLYDGRPIVYRDPYSAVELLRIAWRYGFRHDGDQLFVRVSCNEPWEAVATDPLIADFFHRTKELGL